MLTTTKTLFSVQHLYGLRAGERYRYYSGNFLADIMRSEQDSASILRTNWLVHQPYQLGGRKSPEQIAEGVQRYAGALRFLKEEAERLQHDGRVRLSEKKLQKEIVVSEKDSNGNIVDKPYRVPLIEYFATGL